MSEAEQAAVLAQLDARRKASLRRDMIPQDPAPKMPE
jgi:hypothetical protein